MFVSMMVAVIVSVNASNRAIHQQAVQREAQQQEARRAACLVIVSQDDAFHEGTAPITEAGKRAADAWRNLRKVFQCDVK